LAKQFAAACPKTGFYSPPKEKKRKKKPKEEKEKPKTKS